MGADASDDRATIAAGVRAILWGEAAASTRLDHDPDGGTLVIEDVSELDEPGGQR
jgi:hypothetical protein